MNNFQFLEVLKKSFITYLQTGARSNKKLEIFFFYMQCALIFGERTQNSWTLCR